MKQVSITITDETYLILLNKCKIKNCELDEYISNLVKNDKTRVTNKIEYQSKYLRKLISPNGDEVVFDNIVHFCNEYSLTRSKVYLLLNKTTKQHNGWTLPKERQNRT